MQVNDYSSICQKVKYCKSEAIVLHIRESTVEAIASKLNSIAIRNSESK